MDYRGEAAEVIEVKVGERFVISLAARPAAGYTWFEKYDPQALEAIRTNDLRLEGPEPGAGGEEEFEFEAIAPGETVIELQYRREWESTARETRTYRVRIV